MGKPFYTSAAKQDLEDILAYIARDKPDAAMDWIEKVGVSLRSDRYVSERWRE